MHTRIGGRSNTLRAGVAEYSGFSLAVQRTRAMATSDDDSAAAAASHAAVVDVCRRL